jgi:transcriptional regulator with XRE-family HTH domain
MNLDPCTIAAVGIALDGTTQKALAQRLGVSQGTISHIMHRRHANVSLAMENKVRVGLGMSPLPAPITIPPCPDCGSAHHGRCYNKNVILRPVRGKREPLDLFGYTSQELARMIRERVTW